MPRFASVVFAVAAGLLLPLAFPGSPQAAGSKKQDGGSSPSPDAGAIPLIGGCTGTGGNCTMPDGCPGVKSCQDGLWVCIYRGTGSIACTACGQSGSRACTLSGPSSTCSVSITTQSCNCNGTQTCNQVPNGTWNACSTPATQSCSLNGCGGTHTCTNNVWSACACPDNSPASCTTACQTAGSSTCDTSCNFKAPCRAAFETANNCDDTGDGQIDEGVFQTSCDL